jgi:hypothetical protein
MTVIKLNHRKLTVVDDDVVRFVSQINWRARLGSNNLDWYAVAPILRFGKTVYVSLARFVMDAPEGVLVDHWNGDTLDNRRRNLRFATNAENQHNQRRLRVDNTSGYKGVSLYRNGKWCAQIYVDTKRINLGYFVQVEDAARAYDEAAVRYFGEFAATNAVVLR